MVKAHSELMKRIQSGKFVFTGELEPLKTTDLSEVITEAKLLKGYVEACNVTDNPASNVTVSSLVAAYLIQKEAGIETVYQLRCSDRNRIALTSDLLGAAALGIKNILALTGDHTLLGDMPNAKPVFDLDSALLTGMIRRMVEEGKDLNGLDIKGPRPKFNIGVAANPNSNPIEPEIWKVIRKVENGADFVQTQVCFDIEKTIEFLRMFKIFEVPVLIGIFPMKSYGVAAQFDKFVPGVSVPKDLLTKFKQVKSKAKSKEERRKMYDKINLEFFTPFITELMKSGLSAGCHVMSVHYQEIVPKLFREMGLTKALIPEAVIPETVIPEAIIPVVS
ncbi:methylenetetrahydrofolate reductase [Candidatus Bathyarchaeota archaeon]|nr:methylenetetrahydrofolate reductase [Candidatus Bathyarchaeota archaeon]